MGIFVKKDALSIFKKYNQKEIAMYTKSAMRLIPLLFLLCVCLVGCQASGHGVVYEPTAQDYTVGTAVPAQVAPATMTPLPTPTETPAPLPTETATSMPTATAEVIVVAPTEIPSPLPTETATPTPTQTPLDWVSIGKGTDEFHGQALAVCDVNGDGYDDVAVVNYYGMRLYLSDEGHLPGVMSSVPSFDLSLQQWDAHATTVVCGNLNGDSQLDLVMSSRDFDGQFADQGAIFVFFGKSYDPTAVELIPDSRLLGFQPGEHFGFGLALGNVTGDTRDEILAVSYANGPTNYIYVFGDTTEAAWVNKESVAVLAVSDLIVMVENGGDIDGDGYDEVVVPTYTGENATYVYFGNANLEVVLTQPVLVKAVSSVWAIEGLDVNGDGFGDLALGSILDHESRGMVVVLYGPQLVYADISIIEGITPGGEFGSALAAGDVNDDGYADLAVIARYGTGTNLNHPREGVVYIYLSATDGISTTPTWSYETDVRDIGLFSVALGDVNGDGAVDVLVGSDAFDLAGGTQNAGKVWGETIQLAEESADSP